MDEKRLNAKVHQLKICFVLSSSKRSCKGCKIFNFKVVWNRNVVQVACAPTPLMEVMNQNDANVNAMLMDNVMWLVPCISCT
jgi:hypothetical protein